MNVCQCLVWIMIFWWAFKSAKSLQWPMFGLDYHSMVGFLSAKSMQRPMFGLDYNFMVEF